MCLLVAAVAVHPDFRLVMAANRDEFFARPTAPARFWKDFPDLLAGRDLQGGGTWLGITRGGRIAAVTNYRDPASLKEASPSRGELVTRFLNGEIAPEDYGEELLRRGPRYNGFNLIFGVGERLYWFSNRGGAPRPLSPGVHGLSNHLLDTPWPKVVRASAAVGDLLSGGGEFDPEDLFHILGDRTIAPDENLPDTGVGLERERMLSPLFIAFPGYGTRSSTVILLDRKNRVRFLERTHNGRPGGQAETVEYTFDLVS